MLKRHFAQRPRLAIAPIMLLLVAPLAFSQSSLESGKQAFERFDFEAALKILKPLADAGNAEAQELLGRVYEQGGHGIDQDFVEAARWYRKVIETPSSKRDESTQAQARLYLGRIYVNGSGVRQNYVEALKLFTQAAETGDPEAQLWVGLMYSDGKGVPQSDVEAVKWFRLAAEQGNAQAQFFLGHAYYQGKGAPEDYVFAHMWFNLAAANGFSTGTLAQDARAMAASVMTKEQIAEAQRLAREWKPTKQPVKKQ